MRIFNEKSNRPWSLIFLSLIATHVVAQEEDEGGEFELEEIIVTGTAVARSANDVPIAVTSFPEGELRKLAGIGQADILRGVPGINVEGGGGEAASNIFVRGLPSSGQQQFTPIQYDGIPIFNTSGLTDSAFDVLFRDDLGIERLEFVRGGVSNLFGSGSVSGIVNYISKNGETSPGNTLKLEVAEEGRARADFYTGGEINDTSYYALSGYYRKDDGPIETGIDTEGGQIRGNYRKVFADSSTLTISAQLINDSVQFYLPLPLDAGSRERISGNNGREVLTTNTSAAQDLQFNTPNGVFNTPIEDNVLTKGGSIAFVYDTEFENGWSFNSKAKVADYDHEFNLFLESDAIGPNVPESQAAYLANRGFGDVSGATFTNVTTGQSLAATDLVFGNRLLDRDRPADEVTLEASFTKAFTTASGAVHNVTFGTFFADSEASRDEYITTYLGEFNDQPDLVSVTYTNPVTNQVEIASLDGLVSGTQIANETNSARRSAIYLTDQLETDRWIFDFGVRVEKYDGDIRRDLLSSVPFNITNQINVAPSFLETATRTGEVSTSFDTTETAIAIAALYRLNDNLNVYGNVSRGFFFPGLQGFPINANGQVAPFEGEVVTQGEIGLKYADGRFDGAVALFFANLDDRLTSNFINDVNAPGGIRTVSAFQSTEAVGIEAFANYNLAENWTLNANLILQDHEISEDDSNPTFVGNELNRLPQTIANIGIAYDDGQYDFSLYGTYNGDTFAQQGNIDVLESYAIWRLDAGYTQTLANDSTIRYSINVFNITDDQGLSEGSPRAGSAGSFDTGGFFTGRPELPRRVMLRATYDF